MTFLAAVTTAVGAFDNGGSVQFQVDGSNFGSPATLSGGWASVQDSALSVSGSPHAITAIYSGDGNFGGSNGTLSGGQTVNQDGTTTSAVGSSQNPSTFGQPATFSVTVSANPPGSGTPTGTVKFYDDAAPIGTGTLDANGDASYTTSGLAVGGHTITAAYVGDANFTTSNSTASVDQTVNQAAVQTNTQLTSSANPSTAGKSLTLTATVSPASAEMTGESVDFYDTTTSTDLGSGSSNGSGQATFSTSSTSDLAIGTHVITASYSGDADFAGSTSTGLNQVIVSAIQSHKRTSTGAARVVAQSFGSWPVGDPGDDGQSSRRRRARASISTTRPPPAKSCWARGN